jgi:hypothetical protein
MTFPHPRLPILSGKWAKAAVARCDCAFSSMVCNMPRAAGAFHGLSTIAIVVNRLGKNLHETG